MRHRCPCGRPPGIGRRSRAPVPLPVPPPVKDNSLALFGVLYFPRPRQSLRAAQDPPIFEQYEVRNRLR